MYFNSISKADNLNASKVAFSRIFNALKFVLSYKLKINIKNCGTLQ